MKTLDLFKIKFESIEEEAGELIQALQINDENQMMLFIIE